MKRYKQLLTAGRGRVVFIKNEPHDWLSNTKGSDLKHIHIDSTEYTQQAIFIYLLLTYVCDNNKEQMGMNLRRSSCGEQ